MPRAVACPHCGKSVPWGPESPFRPFCCERCRLIDLGDWFEERHRVPGLPDAGGDWPGDEAPPNRDDDRYAAH